MEITPTQEKEIRVFETVLANTEKIIPFDRFYVALYDRRNASLYYPVVRLEDKSCLKLPDLAEGPWAPRPFAPDNQWPDCLWRSDVDVPNGSNPQSWLAERKPWQKDEKDEQRIGLDYHLAPYPRSWLIAPLKARGGAVMGVLLAEDLNREGAYGDDLQTWFATAANRVAGTLSSLRLVESLRTVNRVGQRLTARARQSVAEILELIHIEVGKLMDTRDMYVALYDAPTRTVRFPLFYMNGKPIKWESREVNLADATKRKLTEEVLFSGETENVPNFTQWFQDRGREVPAEPPKSWLGVPLKTGNRTLGVIALQNDEVEDLYSADDREILEAMANQVSAALANAQLVERLQAVNEVGQRLTSGTQLGEGEILQLIYEQAGKLMDTRDMFVAFYDAAKQELSFPLFYVDGEPIEWESRSVNLGDPSQRKLTEEVLFTRKPLNVPNFTQWFEERGRPVPEKPPKSWLGVPLMIEDRVLGVIALQNDEIEGLYGPDDEAVLQAMASQVAFAVLALENARLLGQKQQLLEQAERLREKEQRKSEQLAALQDIGVKLTAELELEEVLSAIAEYANQVISADFSTLFLYDSEKDQFGPGIRKGKIDIEPSTPSNTGYTAMLAKSQQSVFIWAAKSEPGVKASFSTAKGVESYAGIPLVIRDKTVGVLYVNFLEPHSFSNEEQRIVEMLASQAAVAIENARLYDQLDKERLELRSRLINAERLLVASRFAAGYVHRVNNLVGTIPIRVGQIKEKLSERPEIISLLNPYLEGILNDATRVAPITDELVELAQREPEKELIDVTESLKRVARRVRIETPSEIHLVEEYPTERSLYVNGIAWELSDAFWNILKNGAEAMLPDGGTLAVTIAKVVDEQKQKWVEIKLHNSGPKVPHTQLESIFEPFRSTKGGSGYGLWRTQHVIHDLGGSVSVSNDDNDLQYGVSVIILLPIVEMDVADTKLLGGAI